LGLSLQPLEASRGFWGRSPDAMVILQLLKKIRIFKNILAQISAEKCIF